MANIKSAKKRIVQTIKRTAINSARKSRIRTFIRKVEEAISGSKKEESKLAFEVMKSELMRGVKCGIMHKNTASRKLSRFSARIKAL